MAENAITQGSIKSIFEPAGCIVEHPIMQCVQIKTIDAKAGDSNSHQRYRIVLSDVRNFIQTMLATTANEIVTSGKLKKGSIVRLLKFNPQFVKGKNILILMDIEVLDQYGQLDKIGNPEQLSDPQPEVKPQPAVISGGGFYGNKPAPQPQIKVQEQPRPLPTHPAKPPTSAAHPNLYPIDSLSQFTHTWTIRARCTHKSDVKTWHNARGEGKLFSVNLLDETGEIKATGFQETCERLYDVFQEGMVYYISSPCRVTIAKKQFSTLPNDYELNFERDTVVEKAEDQANAPQVRYNFTKIGDLQSVEKDTTTDAIGILKEIQEVTTISSKSGKDFNKRELTIADDTQTSVRLTIWGNTANTFDVPLESVIAFKGVKVSDFGGRSLSLLSSGSMTVDPDIEEAHNLKGWYDKNGQNVHFSSHANIGSNNSAKAKLISQVLEEEIGLTIDEPTYFSLKASVVYVKHQNTTITYPACQSPDCQKKVLETSEGEWECVKCDKKWDKPRYRYVMQVNVADHTGQLWLSCMGETGEKVAGMSADDLMALKFQDEENNTRTHEEVLQNAACKMYNFRVRAKMEVYNDTPKVRYQVLGINNINFSQECRNLANILKQYDLNSDSLFVQ